MTDLALQLARIPVFILLALGGAMAVSGVAWFWRRARVQEDHHLYLVCAVCGGDDPEYDCRDCDASLCWRCRIYENGKGPFCRDADACFARLETTREGDAA